MAFTPGVAPSLMALLFVVVLLAGIVPRLLIRRGQDRLAKEILDRASEPDRYELLTRAEKFAGSYRRLPGVLGMNRAAGVFERRFQPPLEIPLAGIRKLSTGKLPPTGR